MRSLAILVATLVTSLCASDAAAQPPPGVDGHTRLTLEQLISTEIPVVHGASRFAQEVVDAPSSITIVTRDEIARFGYRTIADLLRGVRGFYVTYDRNYAYVGTRGLARPGDYNTRILVLVNRHQLNDNIYDLTLLETAFVIVDSRDEGTCTLCFQVVDTGIGISEEKHGAIFEPFTQSDGSTTRHFGGTGLGLTISLKLVTLMGGRLSVDSRAGQGSTFQFTAVFGVAAVPRHAPDGVLAGVPVLVVDDNALNRQILERMLGRWQMDVRSAAGGAEALAAVAAGDAAGRPFRLILLDAQMPEMDGCDVAERLQAMPEARGAIVMMLSSSSGDSQEAGRCRAAGITAQLMKPVSSADLMRTVARLLPDSASDAETARSEAAGAPGPVRRVLLAEDNPINCALATAILERRGHQVLVAHTGLEALEILARETVDVVLTDVQMPGMGGLEATRRIREQEPRGRRLPIIAMTAHAMKGDRERCLVAGMDEYISKPIDSQRLLALIEQLTGGASAAADAPGGHLPVTDFPELVERVGGDVDLAREMARLFVPDAMRLLARIEDAYEQGDLEALSRAAHALKGAASNFGQSDTVTMAAALERAGRDGDREGAVALRGRLASGAARLLAEVRRFTGEPVCAS